MKFKKLQQEALPAVELILTAEEATVLTAILGKISGYADDDSPRVFMTSLYKILDDHGYKTRPYGGGVTWRGNKFTFSHDMVVEKE